MRNIAGPRLRAGEERRLLESGGEENDPKRNQREKRRRRRRVGTDLEDELAKGGRLGQEKQQEDAVLAGLYEARTHLFSRISLGSSRKP